MSEGGKEGLCRGSVFELQPRKKKKKRENQLVGCSGVQKCLAFVGPRVQSPVLEKFKLCLKLNVEEVKMSIKQKEKEQKGRGGWGRKEVRKKTEVGDRPRDREGKEKEENQRLTKG